MLSYGNMGPQLVLTSKDCMQESHLRESNYLNKGIDRSTFYGGKSSRIKRECNNCQLIFENKSDSELFSSPKRSRLNNEDSPRKSGETNRRYPQARSGIKSSLLSVLENQDEMQTPVTHQIERRGHTWKVKIGEGCSQNENVRGRCKSSGKSRGPAASSSSRRQFGKVLPKMYGSARQCLEFSCMKEETLSKLVTNTLFTDDDDKENIGSEARLNGNSQINIEGIIESLDVDLSPIKQASISKIVHPHELFENGGEKNTSPEGPAHGSEKLCWKQDQCKLDEEPHQIGFPNPAGSNKCWMNATLQALLGLEPLVRDMACTFQQLDAHMRPAGTAKVLNAFLMLVRSYQKKKLPVIKSSLLTLSRTLGFLDKIFLGKCQQDAAEFLVRLLDCFRDEFEKAIAAEKLSEMDKISLEDLVANGDTDATPKMSNPITDNVGFTLKETSSCTRCKESADKKQDHLVLFVDIPRLGEGHSPSLQDAVDYYMKADTRELTCTKCANPERSVVTTIQKLPRCLIIQVKRYTMQNSKAGKLADALAIPLDFSLKTYVADDTMFPSLMKPDFSHCSANEEDSLIHCDVPIEIDSDCDDDDKDLQEAVRQSLLTHEEQEHSSDDCVDRNLNERLQAVSLPLDQSFSAEESTCSPKSEISVSSPEFSYRLVGVISHHGLSPNSGHYVADVYSHQQRKWYHCDDETVYETSYHEMTGHNLQCNGYIFFYMYRPLFEQLSTEVTTTCLKTEHQYN